MFHGLLIEVWGFHTAKTTRWMTAIAVFIGLLCITAWTRAEPLTNSTPASTHVRWVAVDPQHQSALIAGKEDAVVVRAYGQTEHAEDVRIWRDDARWEASDPHACVYVRVGEDRVGHGRDNAVRVAADEDQQIALTIGAKADCGWLEDARVRAVPVLFESGGDAVRVELPYQLQNDSAVPDDMRVEVRAGGASVQRSWPVYKQSAEALTYRFTLEPERSSPAWPTCLNVRWANASDASSGHVLETTIGGEYEVRDLTLHMEAARSCPAQRVHVPVRIRALSAPEGVEVDAMRVLTLEVLPARRRGLWLWVVGVLGLCGIVAWRVRARRA